MQSLNSLRNQLRSLSKDELGTLKAFLVIHNKKPKTLTLVNMLLDSDSTDQEIKQKLCPSGKASAFSTLISDLRERLHDSLLLNNNLKRRNIYEDSQRQKAWVAKKMIVCDILIDKGVMEDALELYDKIIERSVEYEFYTPLIEALTVKRNLISVFEGEESLGNIQQRIDHYRTCKEAVEHARMLYQQLVAVSYFKSTDLHQLEVLRAQVAQLEESFIINHSKTLFYYLVRVKLYILEKEKKFKESISLLQSLQQAVKSSKALKSTKKKAWVELLLTDMHLIINQCNDAVTPARKAVSLFKTGSFNQLLAREYLFLSNFHNGKFGEAHSEIKSLVSSTPSKYAFYKAKRYYFHAGVLLILGRHKYAHDCLQFTKALDSDKNGWNIAVRILDIMNQIEWGGLSHSADAHIDNLRNHIYTTKKLKPISTRHLAILDVLKALVKEGFNFNLVAEQKAEVLHKLSSDQQGYEWSMTSPELIRFDSWFMSKVRKVKYRYDLALV